MKDTFGRLWAKLSDLHDGSLVRLDSGFTCRKAGAAMIYRHENGKLYFFCDDGCHFIEGQADDGIRCVGMYPAKDMEHV